MNRIKDKSTSILIAAMLLVVAGAAVFLLISQLQPTTTLSFGNGVFKARIASTPLTREKGLGGVLELGSQQAMIFVFPRDDTWQIWMKDMKVPIDIVWLNHDKKVVYMVKNVSPESSTNTKFTPTSVARYVVELPVGSIVNQRIQIGDTASFELNSGIVK
ncbi:MAG: DUF192 domain-containing protein [Candidatus Saccharibacteria bacterium]